MTGERRDAALLALLATVVVLPAFLPGAEGYMDNGPHLVTLRALAMEVLPEDRWFTGWSDLAEAGSAVGQVNAPLAWTALAALGAVGVPMTPLYLLSIALSNVALAWGAWSFGGRLLRDPRAAFWGAALAAVSLPELYGIAGATAGMWPFRLATGLFFWRIGRDDTLPTRAAWIAGLLLLHTYAGIAGLGWAVLDGVRRDLRLALTWFGALLLGLGLAAFFWVPLLDPGVREVYPEPWRTLLDLVPILLAPVDFRPMLSRGAQMRLLGGFWGLPAALLVPVGLALGARQLRSVDRALLVRVGAAAVALLVAVGLVVPLADWHGLGPNPWRYYVFVRVPMIVLAGLGIGAAPWGRAAVLVAALSTTIGGLGLIPHRLAEPGVSTWSDVEATWDEVARSQPRGRVYVEETASKGEDRDGIWNSHLPALLAERTGLPIVGTWYGITTVRSHMWTTSEGPYFLGARVVHPEFNVDHFHTMFQLYQVDTVVTATEDIAAMLALDARFRVLGRHGRFTTFRLVAPLLPDLGVAPTAGALSGIQARRGHVEADLQLTAPTAPVRTRQTWHPWWRATIDGAEVPVQIDEGTGLAVIAADRSGHLVLGWADRDRAGKALSVGSLVIWLVLAARGARRGG